jgi:hypothetical protein
MRTITAQAYSTSSDEVLVYLKTSLKPIRGYSIILVRGETIL